MQLDAFRCVEKRFDTSGNFRVFLIFSNGNFWSVFWSWGLTFMDVLHIGGLTIIGANYREVALLDSKDSPRLTEAMEARRSHGNVCGIKQRNISCLTGRNL